MSSTFSPNITQENSIQITTDIYDHNGAALYIAVILVWYSTGLAMMLFLQVRPRTLQQQFLFDSMNSPKKNQRQSLSKNPFANYQNIQADNTRKQILNELKDPERRQRIWKIYYGSPDKQDEPYPQYYQTITSDGVTINRIKRKLADIHRMNEISSDNLIVSSNILPTQNNRSSTISNSDSTKFFTKRFQSLRRPIGNTSSITTTNTQTFLPQVPVSANTELSNIAIEMKPLISENTSTMPQTNSSHKQNNLFVNRFTIEKVSNNNPTCPTNNENTSE